MRTNITFAVLLLTLQNSLVLGSFCELSVESTCPENHVDTTWNTKSVSRKLKEWIISLSSDHHPDDKVRTQTTGLNLFFDKPHFKEDSDQGGKLFRWITRTHCQNGSVFGSAWMAPKLYSAENFHNGFLYGMVNDEGWFSGKLTRLQ